jgi:hypothetical protein
MRTRLPRWTWLVVLPMVVGALLLMHGLDAHASPPHPAGASAGATAVEQPHGPSAAGDDGHCSDCVAGHVMASCVAIISAIGGLGLVRSRPTRRSPAATAAAVVVGVRGLVAQARPPDPAWVRLSVMRC